MLVSVTKRQSSSTSIIGNPFTPTVIDDLNDPLGKLNVLSIEQERLSREIR
jgi:hypothetical protein